jgi:hypothetical protein
MLTEISDDTPVRMFFANPFKSSRDQVERVAVSPERAFVNMGYRGHGY